jgi:uncharacterized membrane protein
MGLLILGIVLFLGIHSLKIMVAPRAALIGQIGEKPYRGLYSLVSILGFALIVYGFHIYRQEGWVQTWVPPVWMRHITITLMWLAFICFASMGKPNSSKPAGRIGGLLRHPMIVGIKIWALAHLLANGDLGGMILFGSFLAWAVVDRISLKRRGDAGLPTVPSFNRADLIAVVAGTLVFVAMIYAHPWLIGVAVIG